VIPYLFGSKTVFYAHCAVGREVFLAASGARPALMIALLLLLLAF
jgi:hypothetical protein